MVEVRVGAVTDIGRKRTQNQDSIGSVPELGLFVVADGMGGHRGGEIASRMAVDVIQSSVRKAIDSSSGKDWDPKTVIRDAIQAANLAIHDHARKTRELQGMGTTTTALLLKEQTLTIGHVGDSRSYFIRPHAIWQVTRDHSLVQEKLRAGLITRAQMKTDTNKNVITRSVGFEPRVDVDVYQLRVETGDIFLICSDGLSGQIEDEGILDLVQKNLVEQGNLDQTVHKLIEIANENGGDDNISSIVIQIT